MAVSEVTSSRVTSRTAAGLGFEPKLTGSEPAVLPLHHPAPSQFYQILSLETRKIL